MSNARLSRMPLSHVVDITVTPIKLSYAGPPSSAALISVIYGLNRAFSKFLASSHIGDYLPLTLANFFASPLPVFKPLLPRLFPSWLIPIHPSHISSPNGSTLFVNFSLIAAVASYSTTIILYPSNATATVISWMLFWPLTSSTQLKYAVSTTVFYTCRLLLSPLFCDAPGEYLNPELYYSRITAGHSHTTWPCFNQDWPSTLSWHQWQNRSKTLPPNATLASNWDVTYKIQRNLRSFVFRLSI
jgi:hypothetical protein